MSSKIKIVIVIFIALVLTGFAFFYFSKEKGGGEGAPASFSEKSLTEVYEDPQGRFTFKHPENFTVSVYPDELGEMLVLQGKNANEGFQMRIQPIDEDLTVITAERIRQDLPDIVMTDTQDVFVGEGGKGVAFISNDPLFGGKSREVWFAHKQVFYQITACFSADSLVQAVLGSWTFK